MDVCVGLIDTNPTQLEWAQMDIVCSHYGESVHFSKQAKKMMTVQSIQSIQCHMAANCIGHTAIQLTWKGTHGRVQCAD
jgi:hypothetical protein